MTYQSLDPAQVRATGPIPESLRPLLEGQRDVAVALLRMYHWIRVLCGICFGQLLDYDFKLGGSS